jgi:hypothetical protein
MRNLARGILWSLLAVVCLATWSAAGRQNGGARSSGVGAPIDQTSIGGTVVNSDAVNHVQLRPNPLAK